MCASSNCWQSDGQTVSCVRAVVSDQIMGHNAKHGRVLDLMVLCSFSFDTQ